MDCKELALRLCQAQGVSGNEESASTLAAQLLSAYGETTVDRLGSVICRLKPAREGKNHYLLDAHIDEIGLVVTGITEEGFLQVGNVGGVDRRMLAAAQVTVHGKEPLFGVICSTPPHLQEGEQKNPKISELLVDVGLDGDAAREQVRPGDPITFAGEPRRLLGGLISSKALDDRAGCAVLIRVAELLQDQELDCGVTITLTVQEETGMAGGRTAGWQAAPTHGFVVDVTFARTPDAEKHRTYELGKGPAIGYAPVLSTKMARRLEEIAGQKGIPFQREATGSGHTGTNADAVAVLGQGVITASIGIPLTYMHTPVEQVDPADLEHSARLIAEYLIAEEGRTC